MSLCISGKISVFEQAGILGSSGTFPSCHSCVLVAGIQSESSDRMVWIHIVFT